MSYSVFPVEIMSHILCCADLDKRTRARCCLLSHRFLEAARKWLYCIVDIEFVAVRVKLVNGAEEERWELKKSTSQLMRTLLSEPHLAEYVQALTFESSKAEEEEADQDGKQISSGIRLDRVDALSTFLTLAPTSRALWFDDEEVDWPVDALNRLSEAQLLRINRISIVNVNLRNARWLSKLVNLQEADIGFSNSSQAEHRLPSGLKVINLPYDKCPDIRKFLRPSASTLRHLKIPVSLFSAIRLDEYPSLVSLTLWRADGLASLTGLEEDSPCWTSFARSNVTALCLSGKDLFKDKVEEMFFQPNPLLLSMMPDSVERVDFSGVGKVSLDQIWAVLQTRQIREVGVCDDVLDEDTKGVLRTMCRQTETQIIYLAQEFL